VRMTVLLATTAPARLSVPELAANFEKPPRKKKVSSDTVPLPAYPATAPSVADVASIADTANEPPAEPPVLPAKKVSRKPMPAAPPEPVVEPLVPAEEEIEAAAEEELTHPVAAIEPEPEPEMELETVAVEGAEEELEPQPVTVSMRSRRFEAKQEEMQFEAAPRGRFEKTHETIYRGENLDQPTFRRRGLKIRVS
jgi:hypothetical protein